MTNAVGDCRLGHDLDTLQREPIAWERHEPRLRFGTDSLLRTTTGDREAMALHAGKGPGHGRKVVPAGDRIGRKASEAASLVARFRPEVASEGARA